MHVPWSFRPVRSERLILDRLGPDDLAALHRLQSDPEVCRYLTYEPRTREQVERILAEDPAHSVLDADGDDVQPAIRSTEGDLMGTLYLKLVSAADGHVEIGWLLDPRVRGRGYATEAAAALLDLLFDEAGAHRVSAQLDPRNHASAALCRRLGMREEARFVEDLWFKGAWADTSLFAILAREWRARRVDGALA